MAKEKDNWMTLREAAEYIGWGPEKMATVIASIPGAMKVPGRGPSGEWRIKASMIDKYINEFQVEPEK